ncbi:hypothetical protein DY000_02016011 [Brassica cretica]|uniref:Uncharacterized protein n=1 Tax=Brassica cretica TaxID=69181 RepID=A0ABQ7CRG1_BRACR|nr:hypothetical protein DY000_02016011 [Brassica cretica]
MRQQFNLVELGNDLGYIAARHCGAEYETEYSESIDTHTVSSIDFNESPTTDERNPMLLDGKQPVDHFILPDQCYPDFAFQQPNNRGRDDYSIGSWPDSGFHESFAVDTVIPSSNEDPTEEYDEDYWRERAIEIAMQDDNIQAIPSTTRLHHRSAKFTQHRSIPTLTQQNVLMHRSIPYLITFHDTEAENMNAPTNQSEGTSRRSIQSKNPNSADKRLPSIDTLVSTSIDTSVSTSIDTHPKPQLSLFTKKNMSMDYDFLTPDEFGIFRDPDGHARAMDGRILKVFREDIADILQVANGPDNLFMQQRNIPDNIPTVPDEHPGANTTAIGSHQSYRPDMHDRFTSPIMRYLDSLSTQMMKVQKDIGKLHDQHDFQDEGSTSIDRFRRASLDGRKPTEHLPYTAAEVDQITSKLYTAIDTMEERLEKRCDDIYFPFDVRLGGLDSQAEWLQKEVKAIQRQLASQHQISASIDRACSKSIDSTAPATINRHMVARGTE